MNSRGQVVFVYSHKGTLEAVYEHKGNSCIQPNGIYVDFLGFMSA